MSTKHKKEVPPAAVASPDERRAAHTTKSEHEIRSHRLYQQGMERVNADMAKRAMQPQLAHITNPRTPFTMQMLVNRSLFSGRPMTRVMQVYEHRRRSDHLKFFYKPDYGNAFTFGSNDCCQLGLSTVNVTDSPREVTSLMGVTKIVCGGLHTLLVLQNGAVKSWGSNDYGVLGRESASEMEEQKPTVVTGFYPSKYCVTSVDTPPCTTEDNAIIQVAAGENHSLCLSITGNVYTMGCYRDENGKLYRDKRPPDDQRKDKARETVTDEATGQDKKVVVDKDIRGRHFNPTHVYQLNGKTKVVAAGTTFSAALLADGDTLMTWGIGTHGEMARSAHLADKNNNGEYELEKLFPKKPHKPEKPVEPKDDKATPENLQEYEADLVQYKNDLIQYPIDLSAYEENLIVFERTFLKPHPADWAAPTMKRDVLSLACGGYHMLVVARRRGEFESSVYTCGLNNYGQLGHGDKVDRHELTRVDALEGRNIDRVDGGLQHSLFLDIRGKAIYACGRSDYGQIGNTDSIPQEGSWESLPQKVPFPAEDAPFQFQQIACGDHHNIAMTARGDVYTWGYGDGSGALGHGRETDEYRPRKVNVMRNTEGKGIVRMVDGGGQHTGMIMTRL